LVLLKVSHESKSKIIVFMDIIQRPLFILRTQTVQTESSLRSAVF
jgi:hypothetical protein